MSKMSGSLRFSILGAIDCCMDLMPKMVSIIPAAAKV